MLPVTVTCRRSLLLLGLLTACPSPAAPPGRPAPPVVERRAPSRPTAVIFHAVSEADRVALVPLGCLKDQELHAGRACLDLPRGAEVLARDRRLVIIGRGQLACPGRSNRVAAALVAEAHPAPLAADFAVWPAGAAGRLWPVQAGAPWDPAACRGWCSFQRTGHPRVKLPPERRRWLADAVTTASGEAPGRALQVLQELTVDLDGDGTKERLYSLAVTDRQAEDYAFSFSGLFLERGGTLSLLRREDSDAIVVRATLDLEGDGLRELWLLHRPTAGEGEAHLLLSLRTRHVEEIGGHDCRPTE